MAKIVIRNLTKTYSGGGVVALQEINLEVQPNESLCILGPSGCGKTTLLRIIDCLIARDQGDMFIDGQFLSPNRGRTSPMVFQHFGLFPWKRLEENIAYGLELRGRPRQETRRPSNGISSLSSLNGFEKSYPSSTLRRNAAACRPCAGHGDQSICASDGRAFRMRWTLRRGR